MSYTIFGDATESLPLIAALSFLGTPFEFTDAPTPSKVTLPSGEQKNVEHALNELVTTAAVGGPQVRSAATLRA